MNIKQYLKVVVINMLNRSKNVRIRSSSVIDSASEFEGNNRIGANCFFGGVLGRASYLGDDCKISATIGRYTCIGTNVRTAFGTHPTKEWVTIHPAFFSTAKQAGFSYVDKQKYVEDNYTDDKRKTFVTIGNDVWIGDNVLILPGIHIGDGAVIGAGAVVTKDVEPYSVVAGVPAKVLRYRFERSTISELKKIKWWNMPEEWIREHYAEFEHIDSFLSCQKTFSMEEEGK